MIRMMFATATVALFGMLGSAQAATLSGTFDVTAVNVLNRNSAQSEATEANYASALLNAINGVAGFAVGGFTYMGDLDFATDNGNATTIGGWLATGVNGSVSGLDAGFGALTLSKSSIGAGTATTTFFLFSPSFLIGPSDFTVTHDDGIAIFEGGGYLGGFAGPNTVRTTLVPGYRGGTFDLLYVATNNDPSILKVDVAPIPLPAALPLLIASLAGLGILGLRRRAA